MPIADLVGKRVKLQSGSQMMVVDSAEKGRVEVIWFYEGQIHRHCVDPRTLITIEYEQVAAQSES